MPTSTKVQPEPRPAVAGDEKTSGATAKRYLHPLAASPSRSESPLAPSGPGPTHQPPANFSVINYVGKTQKQSSSSSAASYKSARSRTPYERCAVVRSSTLVAPRLMEPLMDDTTNSSSSSSVTDFGSSSTGIACDTGPDGSEQPDGIDTEDSSASGQRLRSRRSMSVSSSGCSSSMDDRNCDFSPLGSIISCRCNSYSMSDFDDDGFREDGSVSSGCGGALSSGQRSYQSHHHPLHHHHQNVPHHPNNHKGLFDIALKTVKLIRRNQELQMRLSQLQEETNAFIESVMANPENESLRSRFYSATATGSSSGSPIKRIPTPVTVQK